MKKSEITITYEIYETEMGMDYYIAYIEDEQCKDKYKGCVVEGDSLGEVIREMGISIYTIERYRKENGSK